MTEQDAIRASRDHWVENKAGSVASAKIGSSYCALCTLYNQSYTLLACPECPLFIRKSNLGCCKEWRHCYRIHNNATRKKWETACQALIDKLDSLLESSDA